MDAGNFGAAENNPFEPWERTTFMWDMMADLKYDVVTPGDLEMLQGVQALKDLYGRHPEVHVVSANVADQSGNLLFPKYTVIERDGVRFGVTGVTGGAYYNFNITRGRQLKEDFTFKDPKESLEAVLPELRKQCDIVVALIHEGPGDVNRLLGEVSGIDVVVIGHNPGYMFNPDRNENALIIRTGNQGKYFSVLQLTLDENKKIVDYNGEGKPLGDAVAKNPKVDAKVKAWEDDSKAREEAANRKKTAEKAQLQGTEKYVGAEVCARCHVDEYAKWSESPHAHAYKALVDQNKQTVSECLTCHTVGYGKPTGYQVEWLTDQDKSRYAAGDSTSLRNVQCESCHGMGTFHGTANLVKVPTEETCRNCHTGEFERGFNYKEALAKGVH